MIDSFFQIVVNIQVATCRLPYQARSTVVLQKNCQRLHYYGDDNYAPENSEMRHSKEGGKVWLRWKKVKDMRTETTGERL